MIEFNGEGGEEHFGVSIAFNIIGRLVKFFYYGLLLAQIRLSY